MQHRRYTLYLLALLLIFAFGIPLDLNAKGGAAAKAAAKSASKSSSSKANVKRAKPAKKSLSRTNRTVGQKASFRYRATKRSFRNKLKTNRQASAPKFSKVKYHQGKKRFQAEGFKSRAMQVASRSRVGAKNLVSRSRAGITSRYQSAKGKIQGYKSYVKNAPKSITGKYRTWRYAKNRSLVTKHKNFATKKAAGKRLTRGQSICQKQLKVRRSIAGRFRAKRAGITNKYTKVNRAKAGRYSKFIGKLNNGIKAGKNQGLRGKAKIVELSKRGANNMARLTNRVKEKFPVGNKKGVKPEKVSKEPKVAQNSQSKAARVKGWVRQTFGREDKPEKLPDNNNGKKPSTTAPHPPNFNSTKIPEKPKLLPDYTGGNKRNKLGVAFYGGDLPKVSPNETWLKGSEGNAGKIPHRIAERLSGRNFNSFNDFRKAFWIEVSMDKNLSSQFSDKNRELMSSGQAPIAIKSQQVGGRMRYEIDHQIEIQNGGGVYDMNNLIIRTPRNHIYGK